MLIKEAKCQNIKNISINVFGYEDEISYHIYAPIMLIVEKHVDILLLSNSKNFHYVFILIDLWLIKQKITIKSFLSILLAMLF